MIEVDGDEPGPPTPLLGAVLPLPPVIVVFVTVVFVTVVFVVVYGWGFFRL